MLRRIAGGEMQRGRIHDNAARIVARINQLDEQGSQRPVRQWRLWASIGLRNSSS